jgi:hypothetical protein
MEYPDKFMLCATCGCLKSEHDKDGCHHHDFDEVLGGCDCKKFVPSNDYDKMLVDDWLERQNEKEE